MHFNKSITETIRERRSWRTYLKQPLEKGVRASLERAMTEPPDGPFGSSVRLVLLDPREVGGAGTQKLGTYGVVRNAPLFLAGAVAKGPRDLEDFGFVFESMILKATELGLQTCWLGGTFQRGRFGTRLEAGTNEIVPAVSPVGNARRRRSLVDVTFRLTAGSKKRKPWNNLFFDGNFDNPLSREAAGSQAEMLEMVRLAPSASNNQPWRIVRDRAVGALHLYLSRTVGYLKMLAVDLQRIDMGIAMSHLSLTAQELGQAGSWREEPPEIGRLPEHTSYLATFVPSSI